MKVALHCIVSSDHWVEVELCRELSLGALTPSDKRRAVVSLKDILRRAMGWKLH